MWIATGRAGAAVMVLTWLLMLAPGEASAHSGGTDKYGCHRESATGKRHCHTRKSGGGGCSGSATEDPDASGDVEHASLALMLLGLVAVGRMRGPR